MDVQCISTNFGINNFKAKWNLNNRELLKQSPLELSQTPLDTMFNENAVVKLLTRLSDFLGYKPPVTKTQKYIAIMKYHSIMALRRMADRIFMYSNNSSIRSVEDIFYNIKEESPEYIDEIAKIGKTTKNKFIVINSEDKVLEKVADSGEAAIFILNHPNYNKDKFMYVIINSLLSQIYVAKEMQKTCPRPKIFVSRNMLKVVHKKIGEIYKKMGMIPVDASITHKNNSFNTAAIKNVFTDFINNRANLFIFPEGNNSVYKDKPMREKIQNGVAELIQKAVMFKESVRVVPISIYYENEKNNLGKMYIGVPFLFANDGKNIICHLEEENSEKISLEGKKSTSQILDFLSEALQTGIAKAKEQI